MPASSSISSVSDTSAAQWAVRILLIVMLVGLLGIVYHNEVNKPKAPANVGLTPVVATLPEGVAPAVALSTPTQQLSANQPRIQTQESSPVKGTAAAPPQSPPASGSATGENQELLARTDGDLNLQTALREAEWLLAPDAAAETGWFQDAESMPQHYPALAAKRESLLGLQLRGASAAALTSALADCRELREVFVADTRLAIQEVLLLHLLGAAEECHRYAREFVGAPARANQALELAEGFGSIQELSAARHWAEVSVAAAEPQEEPAAQRLLGMILVSQHLRTRDRDLLEQARDLFAAVLSERPDDLIAGNNLAWILAVEFDQPAEAVAVVERLRCSAPLDQLPLALIDTLAVVYRRAGEFEKATEILESALIVHPEENLIRFHLGMTLGHVDRTAEARQLLIEALATKLAPAHVDEATQELARLSELETAAEPRESPDAAENQAE